MSKNRYELDPERLATTDEHGHRVYLYPEDVKGVWKDRRKLVYWGLIIVYLVLPWFYINGKPALMVNIAKREFTFFGNTLYGVEPILFFLLLISGLFFIGFLTSVLGRVWCGWACPQTVFIQSIFLKIEAFIEGKARQREKLDQASLSFEKIWKKALKWAIFTAISLHIAHTFMGYFIGPRELFWITMGPPSENFGVFVAVMIFTTIILLDFGWFREQFCIIACPYGRIQSVMMDENSLVVAYDTKRGEPRRGNVERSMEGDCVNCYNCVKVCPTGIDIRRGTQLECIACTQCIDACDDIMERLDKPKGLIRYSSENALKGIPTRLLRPRSILYMAMGLIFVSSFIYFLNASSNLKAVFIRSKGAPFNVIQEQMGVSQITNVFNVKIKHQGSTQYTIDFKLSDESLSPSVQIMTAQRPLKLDKAEITAVLIFRFNPEILTAGSKTIQVDFFDRLTGRIVYSKEVNLVGPIE